MIGGEASELLFLTILEMIDLVMSVHKEGRFELIDALESEDFPTELKEVVHMKYILVRAEAVGDKIFLYRENFSFEDLLAKGASLTPGVGYLKLNGREVDLFFTEKREGQNIEYEPIISDYRGAEFNGKSYMEIYDYSLKGEKESLDAFIWEGEFGIAEDIPLEAYHKIEFVEG